MDHRLLFTGRGRRTSIEQHHEARTLYLGGRESPLMLRIYLKSEAKNLTERDTNRWRENGWNGRDNVWRIEYELHTKAIPQGVELPRDIAPLWADCLARIRMCESPPRMHCEQNKCPTHPWWLSLGRAERRGRVLSRVVLPPGRGELQAAMAALDRLAAKGGPGLLEAMMVRLQRHRDLVVKGKHGEGRKKEAAPGP